MEFHVDAHSAKCDPFHLQAEALLGSLFSGQFDGSARTDDAMPGQSRDLLQDPDDLPGGTRPTGGSGNRTIG